MAQIRDILCNAYPDPEVVAHVEHVLRALRGQVRIEVDAATIVLEGHRVWVEPDSIDDTSPVAAHLSCIGLAAEVAEQIRGVLRGTQVVS
jgi:hypothetical protein